MPAYWAVRNLSGVVTRRQTLFNLVDRNERISLRWVDFCLGLTSPQAGGPVDAEITWMKTHLRFLRSVSKYRHSIDRRESL